MVPVFLLLGPIATESFELLGLLITIAALIGFVISIERSPADESLDAALTELEGEQQKSADRKGLKALPWFAKADLIVGMLLLPGGAVLLLTGHTAPGLIAAGLWVVDKALVFPMVSSVLAKREEQAGRSSA